MTGIASAPRQLALALARVGLFFPTGLEREGMEDMDRSGLTTPLNMDVPHARGLREAEELDYVREEDKRSPTVR